MTRAKAQCTDEILKTLYSLVCKKLAMTESKNSRSKIFKNLNVSSVKQTFTLAKISIF